MLFVVVGNGLVIFGSATISSSTGYINLSADSIKTFNPSMVNNGVSTLTWTKFLFASASYNSVSSIVMGCDASTCSFPKLSDSTTFTISSGGSGSGTASYYGQAAYWFFSPDTLITSSSFTIVYANNIFTGTGHATQSRGVAPAVDTPAMLQMENNLPFGCSPVGCLATVGYTVFASTVVSNKYTAYYDDFSKIVSMFVDKSMSSVQTKARFYNYSGVNYIIDSTFNTVNFSYSNYLNQGLYFNISTASGLSGGVSIFSDAGIGIAAPTIRTYPLLGANIYTDKASYVVGDNINVEWFIADDPYNNLLSQCEFIVNDEIISQNVQQHDNYTILKPSIGTYKLQIGCGVFSSTIAGETNVQVIAESQSYITIQNGTAKAGSLNNFTYKWGFTPSTYRWLNIYKFDVVKNTWVKESSNSIQLASTANVIYTSQALIKSDGKYYAEICDNNRGCPTAKILFDSTYEANVPIYSYGFSNISILNAQASYAQNDWLSFNTRIDGVNFSSGKSFSVRLYNPATTTTKTLQYIHNENENNNVYLDSAMESGAQSLQLVGTNASGTYVLNQTSIIISLLDANGYALYADKYNNVCPKEPVIITAISPTNSILTIATVPIRDYNFTGSKTIEIRGTSDYTVSLDTLGEQQKLISIFFNTSCILNPVVTPETPSAPQTMNNIMTFINLPAFWGILIFVFVVLGVAWKAPSAVGIVALIISNLEAIIGLWAPYTIYVFIVTWIIAAIFFTLGRDTTTGGNK
jgi:hypothetical protein